jgi:hypothetical protein
VEPSIAEPLLLLLYPLFLVAIWGATLTALSIGGGWRTLALRFPATARPAGQLWTFASGALRTRLLPIHYGSCLTVTVGETGVGVRILFVFRPLHAPLLIPWSAIDSVTREAGSLRRRAAVIAVRDFDRRLVLYGNAGEKVAATFERMKASATLDPGRRSKPITLSAARPLG